MKPEIYKANKFIGAAMLGSVVSFLLFGFSMEMNKQAAHMPTISLIFLLCLGICISILNAGYTYYAWMLSAEDYFMWYDAQIGKLGRMMRPIISSDELELWSARIICPCGAVVGLGISVFALHEIVGSLLK